MQIPDMAEVNDVTLTINSVIQGSNDNTTWETLHRFDRVLSGWNRTLFKKDQQKKFRYFRFTNKDANDNTLSPMPSQCVVAELKFEGPRIAQSNACKVKFTTPDGTVTESSTTYTYDAGETPKITSLTPDYGVSAGATSVTVAGANFSTNMSEITVKVDGYAGTVTASTATSITFTTAERTVPFPTKLSLLINVAGKGDANTNGLKFLYVYRWSDRSTWGGEVPPRKGESVHIPAGKNILLDMSPPELVLLTVEGMLVFEDVKDLTLDAHYIMVNGGEFRVGTEAKPHTKNVLITLHGERTSPEIPIAGNKTLAVRKGILELHGVERTPTWTQLEGTVAAGATTITVVADIDWKAGE
jgi:hypothetical protein